MNSYSASTSLFFETSTPPLLWDMYNINMKQHHGIMLSNHVKMQLNGSSTSMPYKLSLYVRVLIALCRVKLINP